MIKKNEHIKYLIHGVILGLFHVLICTIMVSKMFTAKEVVDIGLGDAIGNAVPWYIYHPTLILGFFVYMEYYNRTYKDLPFFSLKRLFVPALFYVIILATFKVLVFNLILT